MKGLRREIVMIGEALPDNFRRNDHFFDTSVEEVGRRGKRREGKVGVLIYFTVFHGQAVGK